MKYLIEFLLISFIGLVFSKKPVAKIYSLKDTDVFKEWVDFKRNHSKSYRNNSEESSRRELFLKSLTKINEQNERFNNGTSTFTYGINKFSDMTPKEFIEFVKRSGLKIDKNKTNGVKFEPGKARQSLPSSIDWRQSGYVSPIKDQGACGSCWAFSAISAIESYNFKVNEIKQNFSEQQLVDCTYGYDGCGGGWMNTAFTYAINGITSQSIYPYSSGSTGSWQGSCRYNTSLSLAQTDSYTVVTSGSGNELLVTQALATAGPLSVAIYVTSQFQFYSSGVFVDTSCPNDGSVNHGVNLVGYGSLNESEYYILRNSWGTSWGDNGYMLFKRDTINNNNQCEIATYASYPNLKKASTTTKTTTNPVTSVITTTNVLSTSVKPLTTTKSTTITTTKPTTKTTSKRKNFGRKSIF